MKLFFYTCSWAELCCHKSFWTYIIKLFSDKKQIYWYWDYSPQVLDYQEFWAIRHGIIVCVRARACARACMCVFIVALCRVYVVCACARTCACVLHTVSSSRHLIYIFWMLVSQLSHFTVAVSLDQALSTVPFPWLSNHILCKPHPHHIPFSFGV
jgi:hypothetical protein